MYNLGDQFKFNYDYAKTNPDNIVKGDKFRISILSESLVRLEYSENGLFLDKPTQLIWYRSTKKIDFEKKETDRVLEIKTKYFKLTYLKERNFQGTKINPISNLKIELLNSDRIWYYRHPEVRNLGTFGLSLDNNMGKVSIAKGLFSLDGFVSIDDSKSLIMSENGNVLKRESNDIDTYVFMYGNDFNNCLKDYYSITGRPSLIPRYALGNWWSKNENYDEEQIENLLTNFKEKEIPLSVFILEKWNKSKESHFIWNDNNFKNPLNLINKFHQENIKLGLSIDPTLNFYPKEFNYENIINYLKEENGKISFNVYDPKCIDVYLKIIINPINQLGVDFYFLNIDEKEYWKELNLLNYYHFFDQKKDYRKRALILTKNGMIASHRYPITYMGKSKVEWNSLKTVAFLNVMSTNIGNNIIAHDIGGYNGGIEDSELYMRFVQLGVFSPIMKFGSDQGIFYKREPWKWNYKTSKITKDYLNLRHRLIPYLYSEIFKYWKDCLPLIKPFYYDYPLYYDDELYKIQYNLGSQLFISPIIEKKDKLMNRVIHKFCLPKGIWYDLESGKKFVGNKELIAFYKDEDYPVFVPSGAIIPLSYNETLNSTDVPKNLEIQFFPGNNNSYDLYEDDGISMLYMQGNYYHTNINFEYNPNQRKVIIKPLEGKDNIIPKTRNYRLRFKNTRKPSDIRVIFNNQSIQYNILSKNISTIVEINDVPTNGVLLVEITGNNIDIEPDNMINYDIISIIQDLPILTSLKEEMYNIIKSNDEIKIKKSHIKKLENKDLDKQIIGVILKLLDYLE